MSILKRVFKKLFSWNNPISAIFTAFREMFVSKKSSLRKILKPKIFSHTKFEAVREHCSIFVSILRGDHDSILTWPFRSPITFKLLDQSKDKKHLKHGNF